MKRLIIAVLLVCAMTPAQAKELPNSITLAYHIWRPYLFDENGMAGGPVGRIAKCAIDKLGIPYQLELVHVDRAQKMVKTGIADGWFVARESERRNRFAVRTGEHVGEVLAGLVVKADSDFDLHDPATIASMRLGSVRGTGSMDKLMEISKSPVVALSEPNLIELLKNDTIDGIYYSIRPTIHETDYVGMAVRYRVMEHTNNYFYFGKSFVEQYPDFIPMLDPLIKECREGQEQVR